MHKVRNFVNCHKMILLFLVAVITFIIIFAYFSSDIWECKHTYTEVYTIAPLCTKDGREDIICTNCETILESKILPFNGHSFGEWTETVKPSSDKDGTKNRECVKCGQIEEETIPYVFVSSSPDITLSYEYVASDDFMPYGLITPSCANEDEKTPLIVSLHGTGELGCSKSEFGNKYVMKTMRNWKLDGFNAYVLFPHLAGNSSYSYWNGKTPSENVFKLIDFIVKEYNIDTNKIIIQGHSLGGYGCLYIAAQKPEYFSAVVPISPYSSDADLDKLVDIPIRCYIGTKADGEDPRCVDFTFWKIKSVFGEDVIFQRNVSHTGIPSLAFTEDADGDNKSDLIEWMLSQTKNSN